MANAYIDTYADFLRGLLRLEPLAAAGRRLSVVFDFSNGTAELVLPRVLRGVERIAPIYVDRTLSGNFPAHGPNPMVHGAQLHLHEAVLRHRADLGVIFDADGDRAFFVDHRGRSVPAYAVAALLAGNEHPPHVFDSRIYYSLEKSGMLNRSEARLSPVGSYFMRQGMRKARAGFGAEYSGHFYFREFFSADSGILAALKVLDALSRLPYTLADYVDLFPRRLVTEEENIRTTDPAAALTLIRKHYRGRGKRMRTQDGVALDFGDWFLSARASNTEPLLRLFAGSANALLLRGRLRECVELVGGTPLHAQ